jgi:hypothetical protein
MEITMRSMTYGLSAGLVLLIVGGPAFGFGRGGFARGGGYVGPRSAGVAGARGGYASGPFGAAAGQVHGGAVTGPRGTTVQHVGGAGAVAGPFGGVHAAAGGATRVTGPGGNSYSTAHGARAGVGPLGGAYAGAAGGAAVRGAYGGGAAVGYRGGAVAGPYGGVAAGGYRAGAVAGGRGYMPYGGYRAAGGVAVGVGAVGHRTGYYSPFALRTTAVGVRAGYYSCFTPTWYRAHTLAWVAPRWVVGYNLWAPPVWATLATFVGVAAAPIVYDYGSSIVIQDDSVYVNGEQAASAPDYAIQAAAIADTGRQVQPADADEWQPLGVFGMIQPEEKVAQRIFQLSVNKAGLIRGNYYDTVADSNQPVYGSVERKAQRVAWSIGDKKDIVFETGLDNLTKNESTILVHYGKDRTQQMVLVRLEEPKDQK